MTIIGGFSERLLKRLSKESKYGESKIERIVNDVLAFTSFKKPILEIYNINKFLNEELSRISNGTKPVLKLSKRLNRINTTFDRNMMLMCMQDLIRNAADASASRILIKTKLKPRQREIVISVIDNGKRISPQIIEGVFSPFVTTKIDGSGLGLANVQSIVRSHGGNIYVSSNDTTEFKITLPLVKS